MASEPYINSYRDLAVNAIADLKNYANDEGPERLMVSYRGYTEDLERLDNTGPVAPVSPDATGAARDVLEERRRQVSAEGWTPEHDDYWHDGELAQAAVCYALGNPDLWPWSLMWWKPTDRRRNLVKAGALILAEIERLDRLASAPTHGEPDHE